MLNAIEDYQGRYAYLRLVKEFVKSKAKQFKLRPSMSTYFVHKDLGKSLVESITKDLADIGPDEARSRAEQLGYVILRYDPERNDVDTSINDFYLNSGKVTRKLTDSLMLLFMKDETTGPVMLTLLREIHMYFITAENEERALLFLERYLPEN